MKWFFFWACAASGLHPIAALADLPQAGTCERRDSFGSGFESRTVLSWSGNAADVHKRGQRFSGEVVGLRQHDAGFKLSVFYTDDIVGLTEIVLFSVPLSEPVKYRMGWISYDILPDGERVVGSIVGFEEANCILTG
ncbi:hypothetical protein KUV47_13525 [Vannielia litorea]|uniref:hypothetical protein n=1 Tax=Vannielia litorea TaxID=1217970 RepID=UPI001C93AFFE|nr:hypothetical protein [Vannielia litorea]MBY6154238.1 hypothetical protein [Vannielia litorea]